MSAFKVGDQVVVKGSEWANGPGVIAGEADDERGLGPLVRFLAGSKYGREDVSLVGSDARDALFYIDDCFLAPAPAKRKPASCAGCVKGPGGYFGRWDSVDSAMFYPCQNYGCRGPRKPAKARKGGAR